MTEIFVSGTEVFSDAKMTETPYEWRRVDMYASLHLWLWRTSGRWKRSARKQRYAFSRATYWAYCYNAAESWKVTEGICHMLEVFRNKCLSYKIYSRVLHIFWPNKISIDAELHKRTGMQPISLEVKKIIWRWIGHVNRMPPTSIPRVAMRWTPAGNRRRGRPKETWRSVEQEIKALGWSWGQIAKLAADWSQWHSSVSALYASTHEEK